MAQSVKPDPAAEGVRSVERALDLLLALGGGPASLSVAEAAARIGLSRPTLYRLAETLAAKGFLRLEGRPARLSLGPAVLGLARAFLSAADPVKAAAPLLARLAAETEETAALVLRRGSERIVVAEEVSRHVLAVSRGLGSAAPLDQGASGRAILAFLPEADPARADLARIRAEAVAVSRGEVFRGACAIASPVFDAEGAAIGAVVLYGPEARLPEALVPTRAAAVKRTARALSALLGAGPGVLARYGATAEASAGGGSSASSAR
ncbi:MAG: helix-turn-helix domain-containing protein [Acetobacteraceae bacterium]|nr:helix-turn-helix domain-containing protein [Acetobacteraceae bacterium]MCX7683822.1 helix-turn-helix domain-containing protein [Acetobacteraceae bacterium]MDW8397790.1 IclR family transcriptional regulator C-terminal domain-containing protein [Acetobacteraceae bacterium]